MTNGLNIKDKESFKELFNDDPGMAIGLLFENVSDIKNQIRKNKLKNAGIQFAGGITGGIAAAWIFVKAYVVAIMSK